MSGAAPDPRQGEMFSQEPSRALESPPCATCGKPLQGRQAKFCSRKCGSEWWDLFHPRLNTAPPDGGPRQDSIKAAVLGILADGQWHTKADLAFQVRAHEHSVGTRISELRRKGFEIESDAPNGCSLRSHRFRLVLR